MRSETEKGTFLREHLLLREGGGKRRREKGRRRKVPKGDGPLSFLVSSGCKGVERLLPHSNAGEDVRGGGGGGRSGPFEYGDVKVRDVRVLLEGGLDGCGVEKDLCCHFFLVWFGMCV